MNNTTFLGFRGDIAPTATWIRPCGQTCLAQTHTKKVSESEYDAYLILEPEVQLQHLMFPARNQTPQSTNRERKKFMAVFSRIQKIQSVWL